MDDPMRDVPYRRTDADQRYADLLELLEMVAGDEWPLVHELDELVGVRLAEAEDRIAEAGR